MMQPLPVTTLCGYLGAGKTTQLNHLLRHASRRIAVMVNDFGAVQIDAELIAGAAGGVLRLTNGCICCSMDGDLYRAFDRVLALRSRIDHLVIEASGVAEPQRLTTIARAEPELAYAGVVTVICARSVGDRLADPRTGRVIEAQIAGADAVIMTRQDVATAGQLARARMIVTAINPDAAELPLLDDTALTGAGEPRAARPATRPPAPRPGHFNAVSASVAALPGAVEPKALAAWFDAAPPGLHRAKGLLRLSRGADILLQYVPGRLELTPHRPQQVNAVVLIGVGLDGAGLAESLARLGR